MQPEIHPDKDGQTVKAALGRQWKTCITETVEFVDYSDNKLFES